MLSRRGFLCRSILAAVGGNWSVSTRWAAAAPARTEKEYLATDFHVHLDNSTIDKVLELSRERHIKFGIVEHAGTKQNQYPNVLSNDTELRNYTRMLAGKPVYKGVQADWTDWRSCFSAGAVAELDYVLTDAMTFPGKNGQRVKLWLPEAPQLVDLSDKQVFMDRFVEWHVEILSKQPIDILANTTWLPAGMIEEWETYWTATRMQKVIDAAIKHRVALEISSGFKLPKLPFLKLAKAAGAKFSFGSNGRYPNMGKLDYSLEMARQLSLKPEDMFQPKAKR